MTYGLSTLISEYDGPIDLFVKLRSTKLLKFFECGVCLTPYVALIPTLLLGLSLVEYLATVGIVIMIVRKI